MIGSLVHRARRGRERAEDDLAPPAGAARDNASRRPPGPFVGLALVLLGVGALLVGGSLDREPVTSVLGRNLPVNQGATTLTDITAHNSPTVVRDPARPQRLAVANRIDTPRYSCALSISSDGGASWSQSKIPVPAGEEPKCYAPDVAFGADGTLYLSFVTLQGRGNVPSAAWLARSDDGGRTLSVPDRVMGSLAFGVTLTADPVVKGRIYMTSLRAEEVGLLRFTQTSNPLWFQRSDDGGRTWERPVRISSRTRLRALAPSLAVGRGGALHVVYLDLGDDQLDYAGAHLGRGGPPYSGRWQLVSARSTDDGVTWTESVVDRAVVATERVVVFIPRSPSIAADRASGRLYAGFQDGRFGTSDVLVWASADGGRSWQAPVRVNDTARPDRTTQTMPRLAVAPGGRLDVAYYDRRRDPRNVMTEVSLQSSYDHGASFTPRVALSDRPFDSGIGPGSRAGLPDLGSRIGLLSTEARALAVWSDTRAGTRASGKQDLALAVAVLSAPSRAPGAGEVALRVGGGLAILGGLVVIVQWARRRRRARPAPGAAA